MKLHKFVFACFTHYTFTIGEKSLKGTANSCCDTIPILDPEISCALLSHHLVNSCRLAHNFSAVWSMGSKESGLFPVLLYHVPDYTIIFFGLHGLHDSPISCYRVIV